MYDVGTNGANVNDFHVAFYLKIVNITFVSGQQT